MAERQGVPRPAEMKAIKRAQVKVKAHTRAAPAPKGKLFTQTVSAPVGGEKLVGRKAYAKSQAKVNQEAQAPLHLTAEGQKLVREGKFKPPNIKQAKQNTGVLGAFTSAPDTSKVTKHLPGGIAGNALREAIDIPAQLPSSAFLASKELVQQGPKKFAKDYVKSTEEVFKHPAQHPLSAALTVLGAKSLAGRTAGALGRKAGIPAASTERAPLKLYGEGLGGPKKPRAYSRDVTNKAVQVAGEKAKKKVLKREPDVAYPRPSLNPVRHGAPVRKHVNKRLDETVFVGEHTRRAERGQALQGVHETVPKGHEGAAAYLVAENVVRKPETFHEDLQKRKAHLEQVAQREGKSFTHQERTANKAERASIDAILADHGIQPKQLFEQVAQHHLAEGGRQQRLQELGQLREQDLNAAEIPYAVAHMGARPVGRGKVLSVPRGPEVRFDQRATEKALARYERRTGKPAPKIPAKPVRQGEGALVPKRTEFRPVTTAEIRQHRQAAGVKEPTFITQSSRGNPHYIPSFRGSGPPVLSTRRRTGQATYGGTRDVSRSAIERQAVLSQGHISAIEHFNRTVNEFAVKPGGRFGTSYDKTQRILDELVTHPPGHPHEGRLKPGHVRMVPMNVAKLREWKEKLDKVHENLGGTAVPEGEILQSLSDTLHEAFSKPPGGNGRFVGVPEDVARRLQQHHFQAGDMERLLQRAATTWKNVTLTTASPTKWMTGNVVDLGIRDAAYGLGPVSLARGAKMVKRAHALEAAGEIPKGSATAFEARVAPGGFFSSSHQLETHRPLPGGNLPVIKQLGWAWKKWYRSVYNVEGVIERQPQLAALGRAARADVKRTNDSISGFLRLSDRSIDEFVKGHVNPDDASRLSEYVDEVVGRWGKVSPDTRRFLMSTGPFVQWLRVALKFVFMTLPAHHPIKTAIAAGLYNMTDEERRKLGLTLFPADGAPELKSYQQGGLAAGVNKIIRFGGYSSFGMASQGTAGLGGFVYPQFATSIAALNGQDWTGAALTKPNGQPLSEIQKAGMALYFMLEGVTPFASESKRLLEKGGAEAPTSTLFNPQVFPNSPQPGIGAALNRTLNPFRPTKRAYVKGHPAGGSTSSGPSVDQILQKVSGSSGPSVDDVLKKLKVH